MQDFGGKVAVVTGAANGIGRSLAIAFAREGANVVLSDIVDAGEAAEECRRIGARVIASQADVARRSELEDLADRVVSEFGGVNILCNNAGVVAFGPTMELAEDTWDRVLAVNVKGVANGIAAFVPRILATAGRDGYVVNTASGAGLVAGGVLPLPAYTASKHAVLGLSDSLRIELADSGIGVSTLCPGSVKTNILETAEYAPSVESLRPREPGAPTPGRESVRRMDPDDVARMVLDGIRAGRHYIITHPEGRAAIDERYRDILSGFDDAEAWLRANSAQA